MAAQPFVHPPRPPDCMALLVLHCVFVGHPPLLSHAFTSYSVSAHMMRRSHMVSSMCRTPRAALRHSVCTTQVCRCLCPRRRHPSASAPPSLRPTDLLCHGDKAAPPTAPVWPSPPVPPRTPWPPAAAPRATGPTPASCSSPAAQAAQGRPLRLRQHRLSRRV